MKGKPQFFDSPAAFRAWLQKHHKKAAEVHVGYFKSHTGKASMTWPESVAEALCFGWIDGVRRRIDEDCYTIRFTPRKKGSKWSAVNLRLTKELEASGKMSDAGRAALAARKDKDSKGYSYEQRQADLDEGRIQRFKKNKTAWVFFEAQPPGYRKKVTWWVMSAKQDDTRDSRLARLIASSAAGKRLA
jgi:uncharacterized protein YdeI (YjbR/CyaY-like superfamily)